MTRELEPDRIARRWALLLHRALHDDTAELYTTSVTPNRIVSATMRSLVCWWPNFGARCHISSQDNDASTQGDPVLRDLHWLLHAQSRAASLPTQPVFLPESAAEPLDAQLPQSEAWQRMLVRGDTSHSVLWIPLHTKDSQSTSGLPWCSQPTPHPVALCLCVPPPTGQSDEAIHLQLPQRVVVREGGQAIEARLKVDHCKRLFLADFHAPRPDLRDHSSAEEIVLNAEAFMGVESPEGSVAINLTSDSHQTRGTSLRRNLQITLVEDALRIRLLGNDGQKTADPEATLVASDPDATIVASGPSTDEI